MEQHVLTVKDLINWLQTLPEDTLLFNNARGYEYTNLDKFPLYFTGTYVNIDI